MKLQLPSGKSLFIITYESGVMGDSWAYNDPAGGDRVLDSGWKLYFSDSLKIRIDDLQNWPLLPYSWAQNYSGAAVYEIKFKLEPEIQKNNRFILDLGKVCEMATVRINDRIAGKAWYIPYRIEVPASYFKAENTLTIEVSNLDANRIIKLDRDHIPWKNFYDINFVDITYQPFDASSWEPVPSGLLGPVRLIPLKN